MPFSPFFSKAAQSTELGVCGGPILVPEPYVWADRVWSDSWTVIY